MCVFISALSVPCPISKATPLCILQEKLFSQLLTERVCPLVVKLFSPSSKYCHPPPSLASSPSTSALLFADKPTFGLSVRLLRILNVLIREFYFSLVRCRKTCLHLCTLGGSSIAANYICINNTQKPFMRRS